MKNRRYRRKSVIVIMLSADNYKGDVVEYDRSEVVS